MSENFPIDLGGARWSLPPLPFRIIKKVQPVLLRLGAAIEGPAEKQEELLRGYLTEPRLDELVGAFHLAISHVAPNYPLESFIDLPFTPGDLITNVAPLMQAAGLRRRDPAKPAPEGANSGE